MGESTGDFSTHLEELRAVFNWLQAELAKWACRITSTTQYQGEIRYWLFTENVNPHLSGAFGIEKDAIASFDGDATLRQLGPAWPGPVLYMEPHGLLVRSDGSLAHWAPDGDGERKGNYRVDGRGDSG